MLITFSAELVETGLYFMGWGLKKMFSCFISDVPQLFQPAVTFVTLQRPSIKANRGCVERPIIRRRLPLLLFLPPHFQT